MHNNKLARRPSSSVHRFAQPCFIEPLEKRRMMSVSITRTIDHSGMVQAEFESYNSTTGIAIEVVVTADYVSTVTNGQATYNSNMIEAISISNQIGGYFVTVGEGVGPVTLLQIDPTLQTAHLVGAVQIVDFNSIPYYASVNLSWRADGPVQTDTNKTITDEGDGTTLVENMTGSGRDAVATGTVSLPATSEFPAMTNIVPEPSSQATIGKVIDGTTTISVTIPPKWKLNFPGFGASSIQLDTPDKLSKLTGL